MGLGERLALPIYDLDCPSAGPVIEGQLSATTGVLTAYLNTTAEVAYVEYDPELTNPRRIAQAIEHAGYMSGAPIEP